MAKRFTDTEIWEKEWYMILPLKHKCLIRFLFDKCDQAGVWTPNWRLASIMVGEPVSAADLELIEEQIEVLPNGKIFIPSFIKFQYGKLSKDCKPHIPVYSLLSKHNIDIDAIEMSTDRGKSHNVSELQRQKVFAQDGFTCCYCGKEKEVRNLVVDHVISRSKGGTDKVDNLVASCAPCNSKKSDFTVEEFCARQNLDFETIDKRVFERLSNRLSNSLQEKDKDKEKEEDKDKEKDKGGLGEKEIVPQMKRVWVSNNPKYPTDDRKDAPALLNIARFIADKAEIRFQPADKSCVDEVLKYWTHLAEHIPKHKFFKKYSLSQVDNHIQSIIQDIQDGNRNNSQPTSSELHQAHAKYFGN